MDYGNKVDDTTMKVGGQQTVIAHGRHIFPLSMHNGLCHLEQRIPTDEEMRRLSQVIMTSDRIGILPFTMITSQPQNTSSIHQ